jgi:hypothetical protein
MCRERRMVGLDIPLEVRLKLVFTKEGEHRCRIKIIHGAWSAPLAWVRLKMSVKPIFFANPRHLSSLAKLSSSARCWCSERFVSSRPPEDVVFAAEQLRDLDRFLICAAV